MGFLQTHPEWNPASTSYKIIVLSSINQFFFGDFFSNIFVYLYIHSLLGCWFLKFSFSMCFTGYPQAAGVTASIWWQTHTVFYKVCLKKKMLHFTCTLHVQYFEFYLTENGLKHPVKRNQNCSLLQISIRKGSGRGNICSLLWPRRVKRTQKRKQ